jgi:outer membrane receptor protein involved in Fe transport
MKIRFWAMASTSLVPLFIVAGVTNAQAQAAPSPASASSGDYSGLEEILVTANKRSESISKVGASITAFTGEMLANRNITNPEELAKTVPGLAYASSTHGTPVYTLRGIGYNADALAVYPAVSISLDQAPMPFPVMAGHSLYDLERVEVLKGPQGTLFGQNSTGGAINYVAAKPTDTVQGGFSVDYGRFSEVHVGTFISGPLSNTVKARLAVDASHRNAWQYNFVGTDGYGLVRNDKNGEQNYAAARMIVDWKASDKVKFELNVNGSVDRSDPQALQIISVMPSNVSAPSPAELNSILAPRDARAANWSTDEARPAGNRKLSQISLRADVDVTDDTTLTSISTYNHLKQKMAFDLDGTEYQMVDGPQDDGVINDYNEELRLSNASTKGATFRWTVGGIYNKSKIHEDQWITYRDNSLSNAGTLFINNSGIDSRADITNWAAFANGEYDITDKLTFKAGGRYTKSVNDSYICGYSPGDHRVDTLFTILGQILGGQTIPLSPTDCYTLNDANLPGTPFTYKLSEHNVSWKAGLDYKVNPDTLVYANISRGYKAGSFPAITASVQSVLKPAKQESVTSYEAGFKTKLADNKIQITSAIFYQDYRDKQLQGTVSTALFGLLQQLQNVPKSHIFGIEADVVARPVQGLTLTGSGSYLKTKIDNYSSISVFGVPTDFAGKRLPFAPELTLVGDIDYRVQTTSGGSIFMGGTVNYRTSVDAYVGGRNIEFPTTPGFRSLYKYPFLIDGYTTVDARLGYDFPGEKVTLSVWGKNIFNTYSIQNSISYNDIITRSTGMPVTYGLSLKVRFQ